MTSPNGSTISNYHKLHVTPTQAAKKLGLSRSTIYRMLEKGTLNPEVMFIKTMISLDQIATLLNRRVRK